MRLPTALPQLSGRWLTAYRILWVAAFALALVGLTLGEWAENQRGRSWDSAIYGAGLRLVAHGEKLTFSPLGPAAEKAGIRPGSVLLAVNGRAVPTSASFESQDSIAANLGAADGQVLRLTMRAPDGNVRDHRVVRGPHHLREADAGAPMAYENRILLYLLLSVLSGLPLVIAAVLLFRRRAADPVVALLAFGLLLPEAWSVNSLMADLRLAETYADAISMAASFAIPLAALTFPSGRFEPRWSLWGLPLLVVGISSRYWARGLPAVEQISLVVFALLTIAVIAKRYSLLPQGVQRQQVKWAALGFVLFLLLLLVSLALQLADQRTTDNGLHFFLLIAFSIVEALAVLALVGGLLVSLLRYRLYDADAAISRSAVYAALTLSLIAIFAATEKFIEIMGEQYFGSAIGSASGVIAAGFAAVMIAPLHARMSNWAERRFQRNLIRLRRDLPLLVGDLRETVSPERLADIVLEKIAGGVRSSRSALIGVGAEGPAVLASLDVAAEEVRSWMADWSPSSRHDALDCARDDMLFPIRIPLHAEGAGTVGWILLGPRPDGSFYGKDEREALLEIADCVARGISVARRRAERETAHSRATELLTRRVSALESMVKRLRGSGATAAAT